MAKQKGSQTNVAAQRATKSKNNPVQSKNTKEPMPLGKMNFIMIALSLLLIVVGFFLMTGSSNEGSTFNYDVFNSTRIVVAPFITFLGFLLMVPAILYKGRKDDDTVEESVEETGNVLTNSNVVVKK